METAWGVDDGSGTPIGRYCPSDTQFGFSQGCAADFIVRFQIGSVHNTYTGTFSVQPQPVAGGTSLMVGVTLSSAAESDMAVNVGSPCSNGDVLIPQANNPATFPAGSAAASYGFVAHVYAKATTITCTPYYSWPDDPTQRPLGSYNVAITAPQLLISVAPALSSNGTLHVEVSLNPSNQYAVPFDLLSSLTTAISNTSSVIPIGGKAVLDLQVNNQAASTVDTITLTARVSTPAGPLQATGTFIPRFRIMTPVNASQTVITESMLTATVPIHFQAGPLTNGDTVQWTVQLRYATTGGLGNFQDNRAFTTDFANPIHNETYASMGGQITVQATASPSGRTDRITFFVVGTQIPDNDITTRVVNLYAGGTTPRLMTGLIMRESTYRQFEQQVLFNVMARWPLENGGRGAYGGLMQVPVTMAHFWDWQSNTAFGVNFFRNDKMDLARVRMNQIIAAHPGLRQLNAVELEHMAVVLYGQEAHAALNLQYYAPVMTARGRWDWQVNPNAPAGVAYADYVYSHQR
jgi:hypothetical protein